MKKLIPKTKDKVRVKKRPTAKGRVTKKEKKPPAVRTVGLEKLAASAGAHKKKKVLGRGPGCGHGKTSTRGQKGQTSRTGRDFYPGFEGGQTPLIRKIPKRGFSNVKFKKIYQIVNIGDLTKIKQPLIDLQILEDTGLIRDKEKLVKILGAGELNKSLIIKAHAFSKSAKNLIEKSGGKAEIINV